VGAGYFNVMSLELSRLVPLHKSDTERASAAVDAGFPAVEPVVPDLLEWLQDGNWLVARILGPFLAGVGAPLEPHVRVVLESHDDIWRYWVVREVVAKSSELIAAFRSELVRLVTSPTDNERAEELNELAREVLASET
jgi:hypothetical protein